MAPTTTLPAQHDHLQAFRHGPVISATQYLHSELYRLVLGVAQTVGCQRQRWQHTKAALSL